MTDSILRNVPKATMFFLQNPELIQLTAELNKNYTVREGYSLVWTLGEKSISFLKEYINALNMFNINPRVTELIMFVVSETVSSKHPLQTRTFQKLIKEAKLRSIKENFP